MAQGLTVRQLEDVVNNLNENVSRETIKPARVPIFIRESESQLRDKFGTAVSIKRRDKKVKLKLNFYLMMI